MPARFARLVVMNTFLPTVGEPLSGAFMRWQKFAARVPALPIGRIIQSSTETDLSADVLAAYEAPFPDPSYQAGAKIFPALVPTEPDMPSVPEMIATRAFLKTWDKPAIVLFAPGDPILGGAHNFFRRLIPSARKEPKINIEHANHFLQEDAGEVIAGHMIEFMGRGAERE